MLLDDWREVIKNPIISQKINSEWSFVKLEQILIASIKNCILQNQENNFNKIHTTLSGGLDSSFCLAITRCIVGYSCVIHTYTIGTENHPDVLFARKIANIYKTIHHEFLPTKKEIKEEKKIFKINFPKDKKNENLTTFLLYQFISRSHSRPKSVIVHDGIDELLGGYPEHRWVEDKYEQEMAFRNFWSQLRSKHLDPLEKAADCFGINVIFPYLQNEVVGYITKIPFEGRTNDNESKIPLREIAKFYLLPEIIERSKKGLCDALQNELRR